MRLAGDMLADLVEMQLHGLGVGDWQHQSRADTALWTYGSEQIGVLIALVGWQARSGTLPGPDANAPVLLPDPRFILKPQLYRCPFGQIRYLRRKRVGEVFLNASMTWGSCAGCCGRPEICENPSWPK